LAREYLRDQVCLGRKAPIATVSRRDTRFDGLLFSADFIMSTGSGKWRLEHRMGFLRTTTAASKASRLAKWNHGFYAKVSVAERRHARTDAECMRLTKALRMRRPA
jgi:hypothetical protein